MMSSIDERRPSQPCAASERASEAVLYYELQAELEYRLLVLVDQLRARIAVIAAELGLTPQQAMLLRHLGRPRAMGDLAAALACDRSNITGLVDRLVARGLVERVVDSSDRRVRHICLTGQGRDLRASLQERFFAESPSTAGLPPRERHHLLLLIRKLTPDLEDETLAWCEGKST